MIPDRGYVLTRIYKIEGSISLPRVTCMYSKTTSPRTERRLPSITRLAHQPGILKRCGKPIESQNTNADIFFSKNTTPCTRDLKSILRREGARKGVSISFNYSILLFSFLQGEQRFFLSFLVHFSFTFFIFRTRQVFQLFCNCWINICNCFYLIP